MRNTAKNIVKILLLASAPLAPAEILKSGDNAIEFSDENGAIAAIYKGGKSVAAKSGVAFALRLIAPNGDLIYMDSSAFKNYSRSNGVSKWAGCARFPGLEFELKTSAKGGAFRFASSVKNIPQNYTLEFVEAPRINVPFEAEILHPWSEGVLPSRAHKQKRKTFHLNFPDYINTGYYPGPVQMQFIASYSKNGGFLFRADDPAHSVKMIEYSKEPNGNMGLRIETACGGAVSGNSYSQPFENEIIFFDGDWRDASIAYRELVKASAKMPRKPKWMRESPVVVVYCVRGAGELKKETNRLIPYENAYKYLDAIAKDFDSKIMALIMRWDNNGAWMPPYYWPPVGGAQSFRNLRDMLHRDGHLIGIYGSGTAYTIKSKICDFDQSARYKSEGIEKITTRGPKGERKMVICYNIRDGEALCITQPQARKILLDEVEIWAREGVDYAQFFDQNIGCSPYVCYSPAHGHPIASGKWQTDAMLSLQKEILARARAAGSEMALGTEAAPAEPFIGELAFNDLRDCFALKNGDAVPSYQWVYHAFANNFYGNQCEINRTVDYDRSADNLQFRLAQAFCAGEFLTVYMIDDGTIYWSAMPDWKRTPPDRKAIATLVKNLNNARKQYPQFLADGEFVKPLYEVECGVYTLPCKDYDRKFPEILTAALRAPDGTIGHFFVNFSASPKTFKIRRGGEAREIKIEPLSVIFK